MPLTLVSLSRSFIEFSNSYGLEGKEMCAPQALMFCAGSSWGVTRYGRCIVLEIILAFVLGIYSALAVPIAGLLAAFGIVLPGLNLDWPLIILS